MLRAKFNIDILYEASASNDFCMTIVQYITRFAQFTKRQTFETSSAYIKKIKISSFPPFCTPVLYPKDMTLME